MSAAPKIALDDIDERHIERREFKMATPFFGEKTELVFFKIAEDDHSKIETFVGPRGVSEFIRTAIERELSTIKNKIKFSDAPKEKSVGIKMTPGMKTAILDKLDNPRQMARFLRHCVAEMIKEMTVKET